MFVSLPILLSSTSGSPFVAELLDGPDVQTIGSTPSQAIQRMERQLRRLAKRDEVSQGVAWVKGEVATKAFPVQPMYVHQGRRYLAGPSVQFPIRYIRLLDDRDALYCLLPDLGEQFYCPEEKLFSTMLSETVRSLTATMKPQHVERYWPPESSELRWLNVRVHNSRGGQRTRVSTKTLSSVAEPFVRKGLVFIPDGDRQFVKASLHTILLNSGCVLVGETGVGKSTILTAVCRELERVRHAERKRSAKQSGFVVPHREPMFWLTSGGRLIAGMKYLGQWQERLETMLAELSDVEAILVVENLRDLLTVGGSEPRDSVGAFLVPYIRSGQLKLVAETTPTELDASRRLLPSLVDALPLVRLEPLEATQELNLLNQLLQNAVRHDSRTVDPCISPTIQRLSHQYQRHAAVPGPSVDFLKRLLAGVNSTHLSEDQAVEMFIKDTGLPEVLVRDEWTLTRDEVSNSLQQDVIGQSTACDIAAGVVTRIKSAMNDPNRPFSGLLLCGPTGVGKTQLAKSLARYLFGHSTTKTPLVRLDMSEYAGVAAGHRLMNDAEGQPATWIQQIRTRPLSVLLLDEIEKASNEVFDILLSLLDEGRLTDRLGRTTSFRTTVILMTSNLGAKQSTSIGFGDSVLPDYVAEVRKAFRPEFFNRLDHVIPFVPLTRETIMRIARKELAELAQREGIVRQNLILTFTDELVQHLAQSGFHSQLGARPLQRTIETDVVAPLAHWLIDYPSATARSLQLHWSDSLQVSLGSTREP